ncbi:MAG: hypothetical protein GW914_03440, partial [Candidatus Aenigmarchaeota archaeon]|nr:hypothetical protein [Candidatus Aenigmarchaeota archaeon]
MKKFVGLFNYEKYMTTFFGTEKFSIFNFKTYVSIMKTGIDPKTYHAIVASGVKGFSERFGANIKKGEKADIKEQFRKSFFGSMFRYILIILISAVAVIFGARMLIDG